VVGIELVFDEAVDDGALADALVSHKDDFELDGMFLMGGVAEFLLVFVGHAYKI
jgi:hypothetical protein